VVACKQLCKAVKDESETKASPVSYAQFLFLRDQGWKGAPVTGKPGRWVTKYKPDPESCTSDCGGLGEKWCGELALAE